MKHVKGVAKCLPGVSAPGAQTRGRRISARLSPKKMIDPLSFGDSLIFRLEFRRLGRSWEAWFFST
jgi:hypothetical protein